MSSLSLGLGLTSIPVLANRVPTWLRLVRDAEAAAAAAGASLWYVPPESYAARATYGPFVNSDTSGGNPTVGSGLVGYLKDRGGSNNATQATTANKPVLVTAPGAAASALGFAALSCDGTNDFLVSPSFASATTETLIAAFIRTSSGGSYNWRATTKDTGSIITSVGQAADGPLTAVVNTVSGARAQAVAASINNPFVSTLEAGSSGYAWRVNGVSQSVTGLNAAYSSSAAPVAIGARSAGNEAAPANVGLVCYAPIALTTAQRQAIERLGAYIVGATYTG